MTTELAEENFLDFKCPHCGELNSFPHDSAGLVRQCFNCLADVIVPADGREVGGTLPLPVTTDRLVLRRFEPADWQALLEFMFDTEEEATHWLEHDHAVKLTTPERIFSLAVQGRESGKVIGSVGLRFTDFSFHEAEISTEGYPDGQDKDFASEAVKALLGFCLRDLRLHRVIARCAGTDARRCQMFEAAGLRREGEFVKNHFVNGEWLNTIWFALLDEEYPAAGA